MALSWRAVTLAAVGVAAAIIWPAPGTVLLWALVVVALCTLDFALAATPHRIGLKREPLANVRRYEPTASRLVVVNESGRRLRGVVRDAWPPSAVGPMATNNLTVASARHPVILPDGDGVVVSSPLQPTRRGDIVAGPVTIRSFGPLGLAARQVTMKVPKVLRVLPEFTARKHLPARLARLQELDGRAAVQVRGEGTEFDSLRQYVEGDDVRSIDWRASARLPIPVAPTVGLAPQPASAVINRIPPTTPSLVVRTWRPERDRAVLIVIDCGRTAAMRIGDEPRLDAEIEAALLLAVLADRAGDRVQVLAFDRQAQAKVSRASGGALLSQLANALADVKPQLVQTDWPGLIAQTRRLVPHRALVVILTAIEPAIVQTQILPAIGGLTATHQVLIASATDPAARQLAGERGADTIYDAAAANRMELARQTAARTLRQRGITVLTAAAADLAPAVADEYLRLKAARQL